MESILSPLQVELIVLAREIVVFANANRYKPDQEAIARFREQHGEDARLVYVSNLLQEGGPSIEGPEYAIYLDNAAWMKGLAEKYKALFAARVEAARLKLVGLNVVPPDETWYTKSFMSEIRIRMVASYLTSATFRIEGINTNPTPNGATEFPGPAPSAYASSRVGAIDL